MAAKKATKKTTSAMDFIMAQLNKNKKASYADIKKAAEAKKLAVYPIMYGRAQAILGIVKQAPRGQGKAAIRKQRAAAGIRRGPGRPRKNPEPVASGSIEAIIAAVKNSEADKDRYRAALEKIQAILQSVLG
jgi:hypothetical protein